VVDRELLAMEHCGMLEAHVFGGRRYFRLTAKQPP
jgi:hypothetical protein